MQSLSEIAHSRRPHLVQPDLSPMPTILPLHPQRTFFGPSGDDDECMEEKNDELCSAEDVLVTVAIDHSESPSLA